MTWYWWILVILGGWFLLIRIRFLAVFLDALDRFEREEFLLPFLLLMPVFIVYCGFSLVYTTLNLLGVI